MEDDRYGNSRSVMSDRQAPINGLDFFPTHPWATRALCEHALRPAELRRAICWEPAAGKGHMVHPLSEYFAAVYASDIHDYGVGYLVHDFLEASPACNPDWIITNPPFKLAQAFAAQALDVAKVGVALLVRLAFLETQERFRFFSTHPPSAVWVFSPRLPMAAGRLGTTTATAYCWIVWRREECREDTSLHWIPPSAPVDYRREWDGRIGGGLL